MMKAKTYPEKYSKDRLIGSYKVNKKTGCWEWGKYRVGFGYGRIYFNHNGKNEFMAAHRYSYSAYKGEIPAGQLLLHECDNPKCINPDHLFLGTYKDNTLDMMKKGRGKGQFPIGEKHPNSKLTQTIVANIKYETGKIQRKDLLKKYGIPLSIYKDIKRGNTWKHVLPLPPNQAKG